jgi:hypothetical protein
MKNIYISVPDNFELPSLYNNGNEKAVSIALTLGAEAYETLYANVTDRVRKETNADIITEVSKKYTEQIKVIRTESDQALNALRQEKKRFEEALNIVKHQLDLYEQSSLTLRADAHKSAKAMFDDLLSSKEKQITRLESLLENKLETVSGRVESLQNSITKTFSASKDKGTYGEVLIEGFLKKAFDCDISIVSKEAQTADIRMVRDNRFEYLWEAKNYTRMVSSEEVEKLRRDMRLHPNVRAGCIVSLRTGIVGHTRGGDIDIEFLEDGRCILFISNFMNRDDPVFYLQTLRPFFEILEENTVAVKDESETVRSLEAKATLISNLLRSHSNTVVKHRNSIVTHKKRMDTMFVEFQGYIMEAETQLQTLLKIAMGNDTTVSVISLETETELDERIFKKARLSDFDERQKAFIKWILSICANDENGQVEIKRIIHAGRDKGFGEKWIRGEREILFQESAWIKGSRYITGITLKE